MSTLRVPMLHIESKPNYDDNKKFILDTGTVPTHRQHNSY
jgi:hypothetical protein